MEVRVEHFCCEISVVFCYYLFIYFTLFLLFFFVFCMCLCYKFLWPVVIIFWCYLIKNKILQKIYIYIYIVYRLYFSICKSTCLNSVVCATTKKKYQIEKNNHNLEITEGPCGNENNLGFFHP